MRSLFQKLCPGNENNILNVQPWLYPRGIKFHFRAQFPSFSSGCNFLSTRVTNSGSARARRRGSFKLFQDNFGGNEERSRWWINRNYRLMADTRKWMGAARSVYTSRRLKRRNSLVNYFPSCWIVRSINWLDDIGKIINYKTKQIEAKLKKEIFCNTEIEDFKNRKSFWKNLTMDWKIRINEINRKKKNRNLCNKRLSKL